MDVAVADMDAGREVDTLAVHLPFLKARPHTEGDRRFLYCEASNEGLDQEGEHVLKSALLASRDYFLTNGNLDVEHLTILGHRLGVPNPHLWEIGVPVEVREGSTGPLVKGEIYHGPGKHLEKANWFWATLTEQAPPQRWFPSVGGKVPSDGRKRVWDRDLGRHRTMVTKCVWRNLGFAKEPQNLAVPAVSIQGFGEFVKSVAFAAARDCCNDADCDGRCSSLKAVTAMPQPTDVAARTGGAALTTQSIQGGVVDPWDKPTKSHRGAAARFLKGLGTNACEHTAGPHSVASIQDHFQRCEDMDGGSARETALRLLEQIKQRAQA